MPLVKKKNNIIKNIQRWIFNNGMDGHRKTFSSWHIDIIDQSLAKKRSRWLEKSVEFLPTCQILKEQLFLPWDIYLIIYLRNSRKRDLQYSFEKKFFHKMDLWTPPEFFLMANPLKLDNYVLVNNKFKFLQKDIDIYYSENHIKEYDSYGRLLYFIPRNEQVFRVMIGNLYFGYKQSIDAMESDKFIAHQNKDVLDNLLIRLEKEEKNSNLNCDIGALYLIAFNDTQKAIDFLNKALEIDNLNNKARLWLTIYEYYLGSTIKAQELCQNALTIDPNSCVFNLLIYKITLKITKCEANALLYLQKVVQNNSNWLMPIICYARYLSEKDELDKAEKLIISALKIKITSKKTNVLESFYNNYITVNIKSNINCLKLFLKGIRQSKKYQELITQKDKKT